MSGSFPILCLSFSGASHPVLSIVLTRMNACMTKTVFISMKHYTNINHTIRGSDASYSLVLSDYTVWHFDFLWYASNVLVSQSH